MYKPAKDESPMMTSFRVTFFVLGWREKDICCVEDVEEDEAARAREESPDGRLRTRNCCARDARMIARKNAWKKPECKGMHKTSGEINKLVLFFSSFYVSPKCQKYSIGVVYARSNTSSPLADLLLSMRLLFLSLFLVLG